MNVYHFCDANKILLLLLLLLLLNQVCCVSSCWNVAPDKGRQWKNPLRKNADIKVRQCCL